MLINFLITAILVLGTLTGGIVTAADQAAPGDVLYPLDRALEKLSLDLPLGATQTAQLQNGFVAERFQEIQAVAADVVADDAENQAVYCNGTPQTQLKVASDLADRFNVPYDTILSWKCMGFGFGQIHIALAISAGTGANVEDLLMMLSMGLSWDEVMGVVQPGVASLDENANDNLNGNENVNGNENGNENGNANDNLNENGNLNDNGNENEALRGGYYCSSDDVLNPQAETIAARFEVDYADVIALFCQGYGFGEIKLAYALSKETGKPVEEILGSYQEGKGWGQIANELAVKLNPNESKGKNEPAPELVPPVEPVPGTYPEPVSIEQGKVAPSPDPVTPPGLDKKNKP